MAPLTLDDIEQQWVHGRRVYRVAMTTAIVMVLIAGAGAFSLLFI